MDNTSDVDKPVSTVVEALLGMKLPSLNPTVLGTLNAPTTKAASVNASGDLALTGDDSILAAEKIQAPPNININ